MECAKDESGLSPVCVVAHSARERVKDDYVQDKQRERIWLLKVQIIKAVRKLGN